MEKGEDGKRRGWREAKRCRNTAKGILRNLRVWMGWDEGRGMDGEWTGNGRRLGEMGKRGRKEGGKMAVGTRWVRSRYDVGTMWVRCGYEV
ncbi:MAG: hypothetical protein J6X25_07175, partial [Bacteroidales bacterium]|nr:hypothetical protein [Bacteroidales bacterium]